MVIDNIELDPTNVEFNYATDFVSHTNKVVYLTGKAGTGKTTFLKYLRATSTKKTVILAPTGVAAINAGGQTIHSFFQISPSVYVPNDKRLRTKPDPNDKDKSTIYDHFRYFQDRVEIIRNLELLVIDEISMVRSDLLDVVDRLLRVYRHREHEAFGGVQTVLIGDIFQLPPIADFEQWEILKNHYHSPFFFSSKVIEQNPPVYIELKKIYRQNEQEFIDLLNKVRVNQVAMQDLNLLNSKYNPTFSPNGNSNYITLATHNKIVDSTNLNKLMELPTELRLFEATVTGNFPDNIMPTERVLQLKEGAQVMFIKNDKSKRYYNGKITKISKINGDDIIVDLGEGDEITVERQTWSNIKFTWNEKTKRIEEETIGTFTQFPLRLAWAITVHKSQGLTFEKVIADVGAAFASGQVYVALSRCTSFSGLVLKTRIEQRAIKTDPKVLEFAQNEMPGALIVQELNSGKADRYYKMMHEAVKKCDFVEAYDCLKKAVNLRNDFETEAFRKYFILYGSKLAAYKTKYINTVSRLEKAATENATFQSSIQSLKIEKNRLQMKFTEQERAIRMLHDKHNALEKAKSNLESEMFGLMLENEQLEKTISDYQTIVSKRENTISSLENQMKASNIEIKRLQNLKWYHKILGYK